MLIYQVASVYPLIKASKIIVYEVDLSDSSAVKIENDGADPVTPEKALAPVTRDPEIW